MKKFLLIIFMLVNKVLSTAFRNPYFTAGLGILIYLSITPNLDPTDKTITGITLIVLLIMHGLHSIKKAILTNNRLTSLLTAQMVMNNPPKEDSLGEVIKDKMAQFSASPHQPINDDGENRPG